LGKRAKTIERALHRSLLDHESAPTPLERYQQIPEAIRERWKPGALCISGRRFFAHRISSGIVRYRVGFEQG
jgi:hypothetical protein